MRAIDEPDVWADHLDHAHRDAEHEREGLEDKARRAEWCEDCGGDGFLYEHRVSAAPGQGWYERVECERCEGSGREVKG